MNTVKKGDAFEEKVFQHISAALKDEQLFVPGRLSKIFRKKGYYSVSRMKNIIVDISIETYMEGADDFSLLTIFECKDYSGSVPVSDIEEFHSKVEQISGVNVKAVFATNSSLQEGGFNFARSKYIGLIRFLPDNQVLWPLYMMTTEILNDFNVKINTTEFVSAFSEQNHKAIARDSYTFYKDSFYVDIVSMLAILLK